MRGIKCVLCASALLILAACGGGGGGGGDNPPPPAPPAQNARPTVVAGNDATVTLPNATVTLSGSATDDGPAASLTYQWSSDPAANMSFSAASSATTNATFTAVGTYTLTLTVNDGTQTGTDSLTVTVGDAPPVAAVWPADDTNETDVLHGWAKVANAADVGMNQDDLLAAERYATTIPAGNINPGSPPVDTGNGMIVRHGQLVHFWGDLDERKDMKSVTKSMGGIVFGLALDENKVALREKGITYMGTFGTPPAGNATRAQAITLAQLATHTSGFEKEDGEPTGIEAIIQADPATQWTYSDAGLNWLADVLTFVYQQDLAALANEKVWTVMGLSGAAATGDDVRWRTNDHRPPTRDGGTIQYRELASGINANVNAMARVGLLFLRKGMWKETRILSEAFITQVQTPLPENKDLPVVPNRSFEKFPNAPTDYGVLWWTNKSKTMANLPADTYWAWGLGEELIVVIPSLDLVIVRNGGQATASGAGRTWNDLDWDGDVAVLEPFLEPIVARTTP
jgi:CubicO group peptidase (beta-lactamase class C family)